MEWNQDAKIIVFDIAMALNYWAIQDLTLWQKSVSVIFVVFFANFDPRAGHPLKNSIVIFSFEQNLKTQNI